MQLANTPPLQSTAPGLHPVSIHQTSPLVRGSKHPITACYSIYRPQKDERLSRPAWLVTYRNKMPPPGVEPGHVTHPSTNRARRRVTSLIRPTLLPLRHAATRIVQLQLLAGCGNQKMLFLCLAALGSVPTTLKVTTVLVRIHLVPSSTYFGRCLMRVTAYIHCFPHKEIIKY